MAEFLIGIPVGFFLGCVWMLVGMTLWGKNW